MKLKIVQKNLNKMSGVRIHLQNNRTVDGVQQQMNNNPKMLVGAKLRKLSGTKVQKLTIGIQAIKKNYIQTPNLHLVDKTMEINSAIDAIKKVILAEIVHNNQIDLQDNLAALIARKRVT